MEIGFKNTKDQILSAELKIREQEPLIHQLTQKAKSPTKQRESIACRVLDFSVRRFNGRILPDEKAI